MSDECPRCKWYLADRKPFCGACGRYLLETDGHSPEPAGDAADARDAVQETPKRPLSLLEVLILALSVVILAISLIVIFIVVFEAYVLVNDAGNVFNILSWVSVPLFVLVPSPEVIVYLKEPAQHIFWILIVVLILFCVAFALFKFIRAIKPSGGPVKYGGAENTAFFWVCVFITAYILIVKIATAIWEGAGNETTTPDYGGMYLQMFNFAYAPVWEEIVVRLLYIGVPMAILSFFITKKKESLKCLFGGFGMSTAAVILIIVSGVIFGLAHSDGWNAQIWKVVTTGILGVFLGYLFVRFGLYASILAHFFINFFSAFYWVGYVDLGDFLYYWILMGAGVLAIIYLLLRLVASKEATDTLPAFRNRYTENKRP